jgi:hypothetical protein
LDDRFYPPSELGSIDKLEPEGAAQLPVQVFGKGRKTLCGRNYLWSPWSLKKNAVQGVKEEAKSRPLIDR